MQKGVSVGGLLSGVTGRLVSWHAVPALKRGARRRVELATLRFDLGVERIWQLFDGQRIDIKTRGLLARTTLGLEDEPSVRGRLDPIGTNASPAGCIWDWR